MYEQLYHLLFNSITDALELLEKGNVWDAKSLLMSAQCKAEKIYISHEDDNDTGKIVEIFVENVKKS